MLCCVLCEWPANTIMVEFQDQVMGKIKQTQLKLNPIVVDNCDSIGAYSVILKYF